jgi:hypothetical protein
MRQTQTPPLPQTHPGTSDDGRRWVGLGRSDSSNARSAGAEAAAQAVAAGTDARLLTVFASVRYDLPELLAGIGEVAGEVPLIGCSTAGEIATGGPGDASLVVMALGGEGFSVQTAAASGASDRLREAGAEVAACLEGVDELPHGVLMLLTDGLAGDQQEIVRGAHSVVGAGIPLVGGCAGDDLKMEATYQLHGADVLQDSVVAAAIASDGPLGIGVRHGWRRVGDAMLVTESSGNRVLALDDRPALDVYLDRLDAPADARVDAAAFTRFALTHPLGLARRSGEDHVRFVGEADFEQRSLVCIAEVPQGGMAWLMEGDAASVLSATDAACQDALVPLDGSAPLGMVAFDCIARRGVLGDEGITKEIARVAEGTQGAPMAGFYTYGEIARTHGVTGFHNQTLVLLALG